MPCRQPDFTLLMPVFLLSVKNEYKLRNSVLLLESVRKVFCVTRMHLMTVYLLISIHVITRLRIPCYKFYSSF
jgi:hypothetical protein